MNTAKDNLLNLCVKIADEAKIVWDKGQLPLEACHLKNLLTDYIDFKDRHKKANT